MKIQRLRIEQLRQFRPSSARPSSNLVPAGWSLPVHSWRPPVLFGVSMYGGKRYWETRSAQLLGHINNAVRS